MPEPGKTSQLVTFMTVLAVVGALYLAQDVLIPFALAALVSFLLGPLAARLERWIGRVAGVIVVVVLSCGALGGVGWLVAGQLTQLAEMLPRYRDNITSRLAAIRGGAIEKATEAVKRIEEDVEAQRADRRLEEQREAQEGEPPPPAGEPSPPPAEVPPPPVRVELVEPPPSSLDLLAGAFSPMLGPLATGGMVVVLVLFMLLARYDLRDRIVRLMGGARIKVTTQAMDEAGERVSRYLLMQTFINLIHGAAVAVGTFFLGLPNFLLWGLLSAVLRYIPYAGPTVAAAMPILVSLAVADDWSKPLFVVGYFVVIELLSNNLLEPWLYGASAGVSPLAVIVTSIFWTWLWGPIGLLLATPLTVCMVVMAKHVPHLQFINILLGDQPVLEPHARFYQRLVAMDYDDAARVAEDQLRQGMPLVDVYDSVLLPGLGLAERDRHGDELDERRAGSIHSTVRDLIEELAETAARRDADREAGRAREPRGAKAATLKEKEAAEPPPPEPAPLPADFAVLVVPARDAADELVGAMLAQCVRAAGGRCEAVPVLSRAAGAVEVVQQQAPDAVCISALPPLAVAPARNVYRRLIARFPDLPVLLGLWNASESVDEARDRVGSGTGTPIVGKLRAALAELDRLARARAGQPAGGGAAAAGS